MRGDPARAIELLEAAHLEAPENFQAVNLLALVLADEQEPREQQRALRFAQANATRYPQSAEAAATLGWAYQRLGQAGEAEAALNRALTAGTLSADGAYFVADMFERQGRHEEAAKLAAKALESNVPFVYRDKAGEIVGRSGKQTADNSPTAEKAPSRPRTQSAAK